jgi:predicted protein tyrosine phosphatase
LIYLTNILDIWDAALEIEPEYVLSLVDPGTKKISLPWNVCKEHLILEFSDISLRGKSTPVFRSPSEEHIRQILEFGMRWHGQGDCIVHCHKGAHRSSAAIVLLLAQMNPGREESICNFLAEKAPHAAPNNLMIEYGDTALELNGRLEHAVAQIPEPWDKPFRGYIEFPTDYGD